MQLKENRGGKREGAGRPKTKDPKVVYKRSVSKDQVKEMDLHLERLKSKK